jgi:hypothetical protein
LMSQRFVVPKDQKQKKRRLIYLVRRWFKNEVPRTVCLSI